MLIFAYQFKIFAYQFKNRQKYENELSNLQSGRRTN